MEKRKCSMCGESKYIDNFRFITAVLPEPNVSHKEKYPESEDQRRYQLKQPLAGAL